MISGLSTHITAPTSLKLQALGVGASGYRVSAPSAPPLWSGSFCITVDHIQLLAHNQMERVDEENSPVNSEAPPGASAKRGAGTLLFPWLVAVL